MIATPELIAGGVAGVIVFAGPPVVAIIIATRIIIRIPRAGLAGFILGIGDATAVCTHNVNAGAAFFLIGFGAYITGVHARPKVFIALVFAAILVVIAGGVRYTEVLEGVAGGAVIAVLLYGFAFTVAVVPVEVIFITINDILIIGQAGVVIAQAVVAFGLHVFPVAAGIVPVHIPGIAGDIVMGSAYYRLFLACVTIGNFHIRGIAVNELDVRAVAVNNGIIVAVRRVDIRVTVGITVCDDSFPTGAQLAHQITPAFSVAETFFTQMPHFGNKQTAAVYAQQSKDCNH